MNGHDFEREVLRVARHLWKRDLSGGAELVDGKERDGVFYEEDVIHLIEATVDRSEEKAKTDTRKLARLASDMRKLHPDRVVKCWFITKNEPTDRQRAVARAANYTVHAVGFREFQAKMIDAKEYIRARQNHRFGSAHNLSEHGELKFIPIDIKERSGAELWSVPNAASALCDGRRIALTADYGSGKSMVLRELFTCLAQKYLEGKIPQFPVHINLREHSGAQYPDEILERHARVIGFVEPAKLVRAWKAGYVILLLDGFDEITSLGFQGRWSKLKEVRYRALSAVRELIFNQPADAGTVIAGREYYFDSYSELRTCLGLGNNAVELTLNEFTEDQVRSLLESLGIPAKSAAPAWLPKRPLFVATLALQGCLADVRGGHSASVGEGWNELIGSICFREARISVTLDSETIRQVLERVATLARAREPHSPLSQADLNEAFTDVCGYAADEQGLLLLARLPGLGMASPSSDSRTFVDPDFECALGAGDVCRYFVEPWSGACAVENTSRPLTAVGVAVAEAILGADSRAKNAQPAVERAREYPCLTFDLLQVSKAVGASISSNLSVRDLHIGLFEVSGDWDKATQIYLSDCIIDVLDVDPHSNFAGAVKLQGCLVRSVSGVHAVGDLPKGFADSRCDLEEFTDGVTSNASILSADLALPVRVLLVVLRKLYMQAGSARRENAFYRGLDNNAQRYVEDVLDILGSEGLASRDRRGGEPLVVPNRGEMHRIVAVLAAPETSQDPVLVRVRKLA